MARKLKTFETSLGFHDLAIAAPSMKAGSRRLGSGQQPLPPGSGETKRRSRRGRGDPWLSRAPSSSVPSAPVGPSRRMPSCQPISPATQNHRSRPQVGWTQAEEVPRPPHRQGDGTEGALACEREERRRERAKEEAARRKARERRQEALDRAQGALTRRRPSMRRGRRPSRLRWRLSRKSRRPKMAGGTRAGGAW